MKIRKVILHNFRSISDMEIDLDDYSLIVGENNTGKTAFLTALRMFYEEGGAKYNRKVDFPKFPVNDEESWIEIHYATDQDEQALLKEDYHSPDSILRVRRYFQSSDPDLVRSNQSNIYGYEGGQLSKSLFYGARNISQAKLGNAIFIPEVAKSEDTLKLSGPSPFRDMVNFVMKSSVLKSATFEDLRTSFEKFNEDFRDEVSKAGFSVNSLIEDINREIDHWGIRFGVDINAIRPEDIVKNLLSHFIEDQALDGERVNISSFGQGMQRHLIYTMIRLSSAFVEAGPATRKVFSPDFTLILFEEPEAFLHPLQQQRINRSLDSMADDASVQVLITSHSPLFISRNVNRLTSVKRLHKPEAKTVAYQLGQQELADLLNENTGLYKRFSDCLEDPEFPEKVKSKIRVKYLGEDEPELERRLAEESIRYSLWLNADRASIFFARHVIICEGTSDKALLECLMGNEWSDLLDANVQCVDAMGKFSIHRFIGLLSKYGISHSVLMDRDRDADLHQIVNEFIEEKKTGFTRSIHAFDEDLENFLEIEPAPAAYLKPVHVISCLRSNQISTQKLSDFRKIIEELIPA